MNFTNWNGKGLKGKWLFTYKIDGVQARIGQIEPWGRQIVTKNGNPLYNIPLIKINFEIAEIFCGSWNTTMGIVRASKSRRRLVRPHEIYSLYPFIDRRLVIGTFFNPTAELINIAFKQALSIEHEGLVLRQGDNFIKVKPTYSEDVKITGWTEGKGKFKSMLGKFHTEAGDVGTGFTNKQREDIWRTIKIAPSFVLNKYIEVEAMSKSTNGILRHPRFIRLRPDK